MTLLSGNKRNGYRLPERLVKAYSEPPKQGATSKKTSRKQVPSIYGKKWVLREHVDGRDVVDLGIGGWPELVLRNHPHVDPREGAEGRLRHGDTVERPERHRRRRGDNPAAGDRQGGRRHHPHQDLRQRAHGVHQGRLPEGRAPRSVPPLRLRGLRQGERVREGRRHRLRELVREVGRGKIGSRYDLGDTGAEMVIADCPDRKRERKHRIKTFSERPDKH